MSAIRPNVRIVVRTAAIGAFVAGLFAYAPASALTITDLVTALTQPGSSAATQAQAQSIAASFGCSISPAPPFSVSVTCPTSAGSTTASCSFDPSRGVETCTFTGVCTGTVTGTSAGSGSSNVACNVGLQSIASSTRQASQAGLTAVQGQLTTIRDNIQKRLAAQTGRPLGYAEESTDQSLGYADKAGRAAANPLYTKAPPPATAASAGLAVWSQLYGDYEQRSGIINGIDTGRITRTGGLVAGVDKVFTNVLGADALVVGLLTGDMASRVSNFDGSFSRITGPSIGYYSVWIFGGGFSTDSTFKVDFLNVNQTPPAGPAVGFGLTNYSSAYNINRKIDFTGWWVEPTAGVVYTRSVWNGAGHAIGLTDGNDFRVQAGSRFGTTFEWARASVDATLTARTSTR